MIRPMDKGEVFQSYKKIKAQADETRRLICMIEGQPEWKRRIFPEIDGILHECRIAYEALTGGPFYYDPVAVLSRKVSGG